MLASKTDGLSAGPEMHIMKGKDYLSTSHPLTSTATEWRRHAHIHTQIISVT